jgi:hypothetical protein
MKLLTTSNYKTLKGKSKGYDTYGLHLIPASLSGRNVCASSSAGCREACLNTAGRGAMGSVQTARLKKTTMFFADRDKFMGMLVDDIEAAIKKSKRDGMTPCFRLNLTSDLMWEKYAIVEMFGDQIFYDYTKHFSRMLRYINGEFPANYHLTFSRSECNDADVAKVLAAGGNVAAVFGSSLPDTWMGKPVISGDETDLRFLDSKNVIVGLTTKGKAKHDTTGFVIQ